MVLPRLQVHRMCTSSHQLIRNFLCMHVYVRQEMCEEQAYREALRKKNIVPFFHPENIPLYQVLYVFTSTCDIFKYVFESALL